jgi:hypothetical protein
MESKGTCVAVLVRWINFFGAASASLARGGDCRTESGFASHGPMRTPRTCGYVHSFDSFCVGICRRSRDSSTG